MLNINFDGNNIDFNDLSRFSIDNNIDLYDLLHTAFIQEALVADEEKLLLNFIDSINNRRKVSKSQLFQDLFAAFIVDNSFNKTFLEFGATDGISLSNSYMLENSLGWSGILAEPSPQWHQQLNINRPNSTIIKDCIWKNSGEKLDFFVSNIGEYSTLVDFKYSDLDSMPLNTALRLKDGEVVKVETISLNDVMDKKFNGIAPSYVSIDTEGSEYEILHSFNFEKYRPIVFTIEHNYSQLENKIDKLMISNGYARVFRKLTAFDAWYVRSDIINY